jgi:hypothetical protein
MNSSTTERVSYCRKVKIFFFIQNGEPDSGGFGGGGFIAEFLVNIRFGSFGGNALTVVIAKSVIGGGGFIAEFLVNIRFGSFGGNPLTVVVAKSVKFHWVNKVTLTQSRNHMT